ncbi:MAG: hypothetical protein ACYTG5_19280 [Planctomycetota bacterium]|jgi:hypothetical protein
MQRHRKHLLTFLCLAAGLPAQGDEPLTSLPNPAGPGAMTPQLSQVDGRQYLLWQEPIDPENRRAGLNLRYAAYSQGEWSQVTTITEGRQLLGNWADFPMLLPRPDGQMLVSWLARGGGGRMAYHIELARSLDWGETWTRMGRPHADETASEHGFVSMLPEGEGVRVFWLDGREMLEPGGQMALRSAYVGAGLGPEEVLDPDVCSCCQTDAVVTPQGAIVVYRDHLAGEIRDISIIRQTDSGWTEPTRVAADEWMMPACPVNGPSAAAHGEKLAVAWFTAPEGKTRVQFAMSDDSGASFAAARILDEESPLGRVCVAACEDGALVGWLANAGEHAVFRLQLISWEGVAGRPLDLARTSPDRASGFPQVLLSGEEVLLAWRDAQGIHSGKTSLSFLRIFPR